MTPSASGQLAMTSSASGHLAMTQSASGVLRGGRASVPYAQLGNPGNPRSFSLKIKFSKHKNKVDFNLHWYHKYLRSWRIHDILGWIRIWIRGSMPLTNGSGSGCGSGSCFFVIDLSKMPTKTIFFKSFFANYFLRVHVHHFQR
jgi:hypothetical protein